MQFKVKGCCVFPPLLLSGSHHEGVIGNGHDASILTPGPASRGTHRNSHSAHSRGFTGTGWMLSDDSDKFSPGEQLRAGSRERMKGSMELWEAESLGIYSDL